MNRFAYLQEAFIKHLKQYYPAPDELYEKITIELNTDDKKKAFGDLSSNAAMMLAKVLNTNPRALAEEIASQFHDTAIEKIEVAGPGFLNFFASQEFFTLLAQDIFEHKEQFFKPERFGPKQHFSIEFVSANPTGPLHLGHGRGGIIGDVYGNIVSFLSNDVVKEFYINDAGSQIEKLGLSLKIRCQQALGYEIELPEDAYHGDYLRVLADRCIAEFGNNIINEPTDIFAQFAKNRLLDYIKETMKDYGIHFDVWFSEQQLHESGAIEKALKILEEKKLTYVEDNALWFKATAFGDDKDRVIKKADGSYTYIAADMAYLQNKLARGFDRLVMVLGQDHHSYVVRLKAMMQAFGHDPDRLHVILYQLVSIKEGGLPVRMSKRAGRMVGLRDIIKTVGKDVARFFYLHRKAEAHLDFDMDLALKHTDENPVYYIQYAYVRTNSILKKADVEPELESITVEDISALDEGEITLIKKIASLKQLLANIQNHYQTHLLTYYVLDLAREFHSYYNKHKVIDLNSVQVSRTRLAIIMIIKQTLHTCLTLLGLQAPETM